MDDIPELYARASDSFGELVGPVGDAQLVWQTPCTDWDVRTLVNHLVAENLWVPALFEGKTVADVGDRFEGDVLGEEPAAAWSAAAGPAASAIGEDGAMERIVHLSFGDVPGSEYTWELLAAHPI